MATEETNKYIRKEYKKLNLLNRSEERDVLLFALDKTIEDQVGPPRSRKMLGFGWHGDVSLITYKGEKYAIKSFNQTDSWVEDLEIEQEALKKVRNSLYTIQGFSPPFPLKANQLALEFHKGKTLENVSKSISPSKYKSMIIHTLKGVSFIHSKGIVHHDINDRNIMLNVNSGTTKIIDFGLSKFEDNPDTLFPYHSTNVYLQDVKDTVHTFSENMPKKPRFDSLKNQLSNFSNIIHEKSENFQGRRRKFMFDKNKDFIYGYPNMRQEYIKKEDTNNLIKYFISELNSI